MTELAVHGGTPVRSLLLPYGRQAIDEADVEALTGVLRSAWLTTGPNVAAFEDAFARATGAAHAVAVSNGTAALHAAMAAAGLGPGDEVIVPAITFAASSNAAVYVGATPVFCDVDPETLLIDVASAASRITPHTKAIVAVDYAGQPSPYDQIAAAAAPRGLTVIADACHALGGAYKGRPVGTLAPLTAFSFHPVKHITTGEGGMITTSDAALAQRMKVFRNHGITSDHLQREAQGGFFYEMAELGFNYRLSDFQCALGQSQLARLGPFVARRKKIAAFYDAAFADSALVRPLVTQPGVSHACHLYVVRLSLDRLRANRGEIFKALRAEGIGCNVHYVPVHLHPFYRNRYGTGPGLCPAAEAVYEQILTLPLFPAMTDEDAQDVVSATEKVVGHYTR